MGFLNFKKTVNFNDTVIVYFGINNFFPVKLTENGFINRQFGKILHSQLVGENFGTQIKINEKCYVLLLQPTPELWTLCLPHRTQIIYTQDISMIIMRLNILPGSVVIEAGTGSGSLSHSIAKVISPNGKLYTFDFHYQRYEKALQEFNEHQLQEIVKAQYGDVETNGFGSELNSIADAVFLDLPSPSNVIPHVVQTLKKSGGCFCSFSPCIEQVQKTCDMLRKYCFSDIYTCETLERRYQVTEKDVHVFEFEKENTVAETSEFQKTNRKTKKHSKTSPIIISQPYDEAKGHTSYLTFAQLWL